ncbi:EAL domain-containing protein [Stappia sp. GBMRC 2046]|uniref:cyclic-guanylate-specific phosphodiesterase n=1 Tax=Stappia sediminis TaxID=2692190 RepID=A0A7X3LSW1_9HYPH|nr:EAL domain-containing protein [Stappia sediminis]MXN64505.1 EAL domain-containing protein [Stappia sediminis]
MSRRYALFLRSLAIALVLAIAPLVAANFVLNRFAENQARAEMAAIAKRYIARSEKAIDEAVKNLQMLHRDGATTCSNADRARFRNALSDAPFLQKIGLVDFDGIRMCIVPDQPLNGEAVLPVLRPEAPLVGIGMLTSGFEGARVALVSWRLENGIRLFAEIAPASIAIDPGADFLRSFRHVELTLGGDVLWLRSGEGGLEGYDADLPMTETVISEKYPLSAVVTAPSSAASHLVRDLKVISAIASAGFAILFVMGGVWISWKPGSEAEDEFVQAIRNSEFIPYYQPVMDIETGRLRGCEVLIRWLRPDGSIISPGQFMTFAETSGHIFEMTRQIMRKTRAEMEDLYHDNPDYKLSVNLFAGHFDDRQIIDDIVEIYGGSKIAYQQIVVEVTERQPLGNMDVARKIIAELQALGVRVALDDVGTGHGGLAYLQRLGIDIIKIDKMFIDYLGTDDNSTTIVDTLVELADNLGMGIIAEGVENVEQIERLRALGVSAAQGFVFAPALPAKLFLELAQALSTKPQEIGAGQQGKLAS